MRCEILKSWDPEVNLKYEEELLYDKDTALPLFLIWQNGKSVILGAHQDVDYEVNLDFAKEQGIKVCKRITGGGAVYHDLGNVNFSFLSNDLANAESFLLDTITGFFRSLGLNVSFNQKNDFLIGDKKIIGMAKRETEGRILIHGCILFDTELSVLEQVLKYHEEKYEGRFVPSVRSRVENVSAFLSENMTVEQFKARLNEYVKEI
ncbi:MAG: lipoate--protein ligase family protein [Lachnospiraceae bacterium]|nr:lipoate--protein ligase family protein [Lachnospiraceae bacterium]